MSRNIKNIVIVGGGTAGWISAAILSKTLSNIDTKITLVESPNVPTVGVGEATIPSIIDLVNLLGISKNEFIRETNATFKLGIKFVDWLSLGESYWHPFGLVGNDIDKRSFYSFWLKSRQQGSDYQFTDFSPAVAMAKRDRFYIADPKNPSSFSRSTYALHFDAIKVAEYLSRYSIDNGVVAMRDHVENVVVDELGQLTKVELVSGDTVSGDFFIDCTGSKGLLIGEALGVDYLDWSEYLPVNRAVAMQTKRLETLPPYTLSTARESGWSWQIPLQSRTGNGYVYSSEYSSDSHATESLVKWVGSEPVTEPRTLSFTTGRRQQFWHKNCLAVGMSSGFLEPLESTAIYLIMKSMFSFVELFPSKSLSEANSQEFNRLMALEYECIRDFIVLHYSETQRSDSAFWRDWQKRPIPSSLENKLDVFRSYGRLYKNDMDLFAADSWYSVLCGMGVIPENYDPLVDGSNWDQVSEMLEKARRGLAEQTKALPTHDQYIQMLR